MLKDPVLQSIAELLAYIYDDLILCPLAEERELLMHAGDKTQEDLFHVCRLVFGANMQTAFRKTCAYVANYCDSLVENFDELLKENDAGIMIDAADLKISAVEYLAEHAPVDSIEEKAILHSLAYQSRFCHKHVKNNTGHTGVLFIKREPENSLKAKRAAAWQRSFSLFRLCVRRNNALLARANHPVYNTHGGERRYEGKEHHF